MEVDLPMAGTAKSDQVFFHIATQMALQAQMMDLEISGTSVSLAAPRRIPPVPETSRQEISEILFKPSQENTLSVFLRESGRYLEGQYKPFQALWLRDLHIVHISTSRQGRVIHSSSTRAAHG